MHSERKAKDVHSLFKKEKQNPTFPENLWIALFPQGLEIWQERDGKPKGWEIMGEMNDVHRKEEALTGGGD